MEVVCPGYRQQEGALIGNLEMTRPFGGKCGVRSLLSVCQSVSTLNGQRNLTKFTLYPLSNTNGSFVFLWEGGEGRVVRKLERGEKN